MIVSRKIKNDLKELVNLMWRPLPINWAVTLERKTTHRWLKLITRAAMLNRDGVIYDGVGKGLGINVGYSNPDYLLGINERPIQALLHQNLKEGSVFYDVGANVGFFSLIAARLVGEHGRVYAFEPEARNLTSLHRNVELNHSHNISVIEAAVSKEAGTGRLFLADYAGGHSLYQSETSSNDTNAGVPVTTVSLDDLVESKQILPPTIVKIDVESGELDVLKGMSRLLIEHRPIVIYEVDDERSDQLSVKKSEIADFLEQFYYDTKDLPGSYTGGDWLVSHTIARPRNSALK